MVEDGDYLMAMTAYCTVVQTRPEVEVMQTSTERRSPGGELPRFAVQEAVPDAFAMPEHPLLRLVKLKVAVIGTPAPTC